MNAGVDACGRDAVRIPTRHLYRPLREAHRLDLKTPRPPSQTCASLNARPWNGSNGRSGRLLTSQPSRIPRSCAITWQSRSRR
jgi:hypothetical protein